MAFSDQTLSIEHGEPKKVKLPDVPEELEALTREAAGGEARRTFGRMLTLVVYSDAEEKQDLHQLVGEIVLRASGRAIVVRRANAAEDGELEAYVSTHCYKRGDEDADQCAELVTLHVPPDEVEDVQNMILSLRLRDLPLVVWWRARANFDDPLFAELIAACDQVILDSCRFDTPMDELMDLVRRLRLESERVPFGDINWARLAPWRELIAQFFDNPEHLDYLNRLDEMELVYSARERGNPAQAILLTMWLATMLHWEVVAGSWRQAGRNRSLRLRRDEQEIRVEVRGDPNSEAPSGWLCGVTLRVTGAPAAEFRIDWCGEDCVTTSVNVGPRVSERSSALYIPDEVTLVCEEFDASRRDRVYHHALHVLEELVR